MSTISEAKAAGSRLHLSQSLSFSLNDSAVQDSETEKKKEPKKGTIIAVGDKIIVLPSNISPVKVVVGAVKAMDVIVKTVKSWLPF